MTTSDDLTYATYWLTRDRCCGRLADVVDVWLVRPTYFRLDDGDLYWVAPLDLEDRSAARFDSWPIAHAMEQSRSLPAHELECVRVGSPEADPYA